MKILFVLCAFILTEVKLQEHDDPLNSFLHLKKNVFKMEPRIIGGADVLPHSYPFQAVLYITYKKRLYLCGGTLIDPRWILTAAHCVHSNNMVIDIILGAHNLTNLGAQDTIQKFRSTSYRKHPRYNNRLKLNDIALIKLPENAILNEYVNVVPISNGKNNYAGEMGTILGWGTTDDGTLPKTLKSVTVKVMSNRACKWTSPVLIQAVKQSHVCVSGAGPKGGCGGDSGGPLLVNGTQIGVASFIVNSCTMGMPTVFTRLNQFNDWIIKNINSNSDEVANVGDIVVRFVDAIFAFISFIVNLLF
ncbi:unnamed protein product [Phaedon cochleariae]|uniref:Peptidase S1 domain-containing protein n=1 Tax=Phaedon cochleariae TaxID=80249 RepID=A0A9P0DKU0_PHACE|nr:unnamed protein product [Phaedon cochleariae]